MPLPHLNKIHEKLCPDLRKNYRPDYMQALDVINRFDLKKIEPREALLCLHEIVNLVEFPENRYDQGRKTRFDAENLIPKILESLDIKTTNHIFYKEKIAQIAQILQQGNLKEIERIFLPNKNPAS